MISMLPVLTAHFCCSTNTETCFYSVWFVCVFQHALRLLAFGQLYTVLNMDPLPASKPSPRLLEGVCSNVFSCSCESTVYGRSLQHQNMASFTTILQHWFHCGVTVLILFKLFWLFPLFLFYHCLYSFFTFTSTKKVLCLNLPVKLL